MIFVFLKLENRKMSCAWCKESGYVAKVKGKQNKLFLKASFGRVAGMMMRIIANSDSWACNVGSSKIERM